MLKILLGSTVLLLILIGSAVAAEFDTEAAIAAYLETLYGEARDRSDAYFEGGYWLLLWGTLVAIIADGLFLRFRWSAKIRDLADRITSKRWLHPGIYIIPYVVISALITFPWMMYTSYFREKKYGLMNLTIADWLNEQLIGLAIGTVMAIVLVTLIFTVIRLFPKAWWILGAAVMSGFMMVVIMISPVYIAPLFNDYKEMEAGDLRDQIVAMAQANDVPAENIYVFDQSKQHDRISANVSGFANTMRISLNDNLLLRSTPAEVKTVMGHELGHYVLGHIWRLWIVFTLIFCVGFFILGRVTPRLLDKHGDRWGIKSVSDPAVIPLFSILFTVYFLLITPVTNSLIRINEIEADAFGLEAAKEPDGFASIAMKLSEYRKIEPSSLEEIIFFDHPSGATRVRMAMEWKAKHLEASQ